MGPAQGDHPTGLAPQIIIIMTRKPVCQMNRDELLMHIVQCEAQALAARLAGDWERYAQLAETCRGVAERLTNEPKKILAGNGQ